MSETPVDIKSAYPTSTTKRLAAAQDNFHFGDYMQWAGEPFASHLVRGPERDACAVCIAERVFPGQVMEILATADGYVAKLATP